VTNGSFFTMTINEDNILIEYRAMVERRVNEQVLRHQNVNPDAGPRKAVEIQIQQERERLEHLIENDETTPAQAEICRLLIEWLPQLERQLKGR
jgi:hypothetical protein